MVEKETQEFELGTQVQWTSQAKGFTATKTGTVAEIVAAGSQPSRDKFPRLYKGVGVGMGRKTKSYVIEIKPTKNGKVFKHYWPVASLLRHV